METDASMCRRGRRLSTTRAFLSASYSQIRLWSREINFSLGKGYAERANQQPVVTDSATALHNGCPTFPVLANTTGDPPSYLIESKSCSGSPQRPKKGKVHCRPATYTGAKNRKDQGNPPRHKKCQEALKGDHHPPPQPTAPPRPHSLTALHCPSPPPHYKLHPICLLQAGFVVPEVSLRQRRSCRGGRRNRVRREGGGEEERG